MGAHRGHDVRRPDKNAAAEESTAVTWERAAYQVVLTRLGRQLSIVLNIGNKLLRIV